MKVGKLRDMLKVTKNVSMVELEIVEDQYLGTVMNEFAPLVEESESYSSPSMTKGASILPSSLPEERSRGTPPIK